MPLRIRLTRLLMRLSTIFIATGVLLCLPEPDGDPVLRYKNAVVVLLAIIFSGKTLYDTLFFERYP